MGFFCQDLAAAYFPPASQDTAQAVCQAESGGSPGAVNPSGCCKGLMQINCAAHPDFDCSRYADPAYNMSYAAQLQASSGWSPWEAFTNGSYRQYLTGQALAPAQLAPIATEAPAPDNAPPIGAPTNLLPLGAAAFGLLLALSALRGR